MKSSLTTTRRTKRPSVSWSLGWSGAILVLLAAAACSGGGEVAKEPSGLDPELVTIDAAAPRARFEDASGSILLGPGWTVPEEEPTPQEPRRVFVWAGEEAVIRVERPPGTEPLDFEAVGSPYPGPLQEAGRDVTAAPPAQELRLVDGRGRTLAAQELRPGWQKIRLPLPEDALPEAWNRLVLRFRWTRPTRYDGDVDGIRRVSVAFRSLGLVPRRVVDSEAFRAATRLDPETGRLHIAKGGAVVTPLPAGHRVRLDLRKPSFDCDGCTLGLELLGPDGARRPLSETGSQWLTTAPSGVSRLRLALFGDDGSFAADESVELDLGLTLGAATADLPSVPPGGAADLPPAERLPHVFLYLIDTLRADALTLYGSPRPTSPRLEAFARDAVTFTRAQSASCWTYPAVASVLTGVYPDRHGANDASVRFEPGENKTLAQRLAARGYHTVGISQSAVASPELGLDAGFENFYLSDQLSGRLLRSREARAFLLQWLVHAWDGEAPIFAYVHTVDPHAPYTPPPPFRTFAANSPGTLPDDHYQPTRFLREGLASAPREVAHLRARYDGEVAHADREIGRFLDLLRYLGLYDESVIVVLSDHGEEFGEHGGFDHGRTLYDELLAVPLLVKLPGSRQGGTKVERQVSTLDVAATVLALAGIEPTGLDGQSLLADPGPERAGRRAFFAEVRAASINHTAAAPAVAYRSFVTGAGLKCIESLDGYDQFGNEIPRWQVFDLETDPGEKRPLAEDDSRFQRCREAFARWLAGRLGPTREGEPTRPETLEKLRALGYVE